MPPTKWIKRQDDVEVFKSSPAYAAIRSLVGACATAVQGKRKSDAAAQLSAWRETCPSWAEWIAPVKNLFSAMRQAVDSIPLQDMKEQRFGNKAFRDFHVWLDEATPSLLSDVADALLRVVNPETCVPKEKLVEDLFGYLKDSFGNGTRLDYGTGHELHFLMFLGVCLHIVDLQHLSEADQSSLLLAVTLGLFWEYIEFMRLVQRHYKLEPAGSHGVWGLDDYHHLSFIFGASQLVAADTWTAPKAPILPKHISDPAHVEAHRNEYLYFANIAWILENKRGPFHEHSSMLYNISGIDEWARIAGGMIKMYEAEVMQKYNVVQHLLFSDPYFPFPQQ